MSEPLSTYRGVKIRCHHEVPSGPLAVWICVLDFCMRVYVLLYLFDYPISVESDII